MEPSSQRKHPLSDDETVSAKKAKILKEQQSPRERAASAADVEVMRQHLGTHDAAHADTEDAPLSFLEWSQVHGGKLVEVMAGQHRIEALKKVSRQDKSCGTWELWWTCEFYDLDKLPADLDRELRINRKDLTLADKHGQVWNQARSAIAQDPRLLEGNFKKVTEQVTRALYLGAVRSAPVRRLVTIWRHERWRSLVNEWCETRLGIESFSISTWSWMITCRLHDFWFTVFETVLWKLARLPSNAEHQISLADWKLLSTHMSPGRSEVCKRELFYPDVDQMPRDPVAKRRSGFLVDLSDTEYLHLCRHITDNRHLRFPDIYRIIGLSKEDGDVLCTIITHLIAWVNPNPSAPALHRTDTNKPPLINDLADYVCPLPSGTIESILERLNFSLLGCHCQSPEQLATILLQQDALDFVISHMAAFRSREQKPYLAALSTLPTNQDGRSQYARRFVHPHWHSLLILVSGYVAADLLFEPRTTTEPNTTESHKTDEDRPFQSAVDFQEWVCRFIQDRARRLSPPLVSDEFRQMLEKWFSDHSRLDPDPVESSKMYADHGDVRAGELPPPREVQDQLSLGSTTVAPPSTTLQTLIGSAHPQQSKVK
ncbi:hypothetical protein G7054_g14786 [Neopestalotiopsis clavispora]|nr:hypothetical protein G7054_g14786 [Neopestalotiopsis clavispora]